MEFHKIRLSKTWMAVGVVVLCSLSFGVGKLHQGDNFPDVAPTHWAYKSVYDLTQAGIITGYPDGEFKGKRPITRYEVATILHEDNKQLRGLLDAMASQINSLPASNPKNYDDELRELHSTFDQIKVLVGSKGTEIDKLNKRVGHIEEFLASQFHFVPFKDGEEKRNTH